LRRIHVAKVSASSRSAFGVAHGASTETFFAIRPSRSAACP
jgi:hypothetical protein